MSVVAKPFARETQDFASLLGGANNINLILFITGTGTDIHQPGVESTMDMPP